MHELSLATQIIEAVSAELRQMNGVHAQRLRVRVGELSGLNPENLRFCLEAARDGTPLGQAEIDVERVRAKARCVACGEVEYSGDFGLPFVCPRCAGPVSGFIGGRGIEVALDCEEEEERAHGD